MALAAKARAAAETEVLHNVRKKHLAAALAWEGLASQVGRIKALRLASAALSDV